MLIPLNINALQLVTFIHGWTATNSSAIHFGKTRGKHFKGGFMCISHRIKSSCVYPYSHGFKCIPAGAWVDCLKSPPETLGYSKAKPEEAGCALH